MSQLFVEITDDLSYVRTFYPNRSVRVFLNSLAQRVFLGIYKRKSSGFAGIVHFWKTDLPQVVYEARREFFLAFFVFFLSMAIGALSAHMNEDFPAQILSQDYVDMTLENIQKGDPMAVYKDEDAMGMFYRIAYNNLGVALLTFVMGIFFSAGSLAILISNGIMVGAFQYLFYRHGELKESLLTIWIHGAPEISAIVIAGAAGIALGKGMVFPGTYSRMEALQISGRRGMKIMLGIAPIIVMAAFFEGFITRATDLPDWLRAAFIFVNLAFIVGYFMIYSWKVSVKGKDLAASDSKLPPSPDLSISFYEPKSAGVVIRDAFTIYQKHFGKILLIVLLLSTVISSFMFLSGDYVDYRKASSNESILELFTSTLSQSLDNAFYTLSFGELSSAFPLMIFGYFLLLVYAVAFFFKQEVNGVKSNWKSINPLYLLVIPIFFILAARSDNGFLAFMGVLLACLPIFWGISSTLKKNGQTPPQMFLIDYFGRLFGNYLLLFLMGLVIVMVVAAPLATMYIQWLSWFVPITTLEYNTLNMSIMLFLNLVALGLALPLICFGLGVLYFSLIEIRDAVTLTEKISQLGSGKKVYGFEKETL